MLAGLVVFELTAEPMLGIVVACLKFAWDDWAAAWWIRRVDPWRARGRACAAFLADLGLLKAGAMAVGGWFALIVSFGIAFAILGRNPGVGIAAQYEGLILAMQLAAWPYLVLAIAGVTLALLGNVRVWTDAGVLREWRAGLWPPYVLDPRMARTPSAMENPAVGVVLGVPTIALLLAVLTWPEVADAMNVISGLPALIRIPIALGILGACCGGFAGLVWLTNRVAACQPGGVLAGAAWRASRAGTSPVLLRATSSR